MSAVARVSPGVPSGGQFAAAARAEADVDLTEPVGPAAEALERARADYMHMSDDPHVAGRYNRLEAAAQAEFEQSPAGRQLAAARERERRRSEPQRNVPAGPSAADVAWRQQLLQAGRQRRQRRTPGQMVAELSSAGLRVALRSIRGSQPNAEGRRRMVMIEAELERRARLQPTA